jgi:hypothetical protein
MDRVGADDGRWGTDVFERRLEVPSGEPVVFDYGALP